MKPIVIACRELHCLSELVLRRDDYVPHDWTCPACENQLLEQQIAELARLNSTIPPSLTRT